MVVRGLVVVVIGCGEFPSVVAVVATIVLLNVVNMFVVVIGCREFPPVEAVVAVLATVVMLNVVNMSVVVCDVVNVHGPDSP